jgi:hypothetical protein
VAAEVLVEVEVVLVVAEEDRVAEVALSVDLRRSLSLIKRLSISHVSRV